LSILINYCRTSGEYIKSAIFGGLDGIVTIFALVAGVQGGGLEARVLVIMGIANLIADGISMGVGDGLSTYAETQYAEAERHREIWCDVSFLESSLTCATGSAKTISKGKKMKW